VSSKLLRSNTTCYCLCSRHCASLLLLLLRGMTLQPDSSIASCHAALHIAWPAHLLLLLLLLGLLIILLLHLILLLLLVIWIQLLLLLLMVQLHGVLRMQFNLLHVGKLL
jgi:hypothetical protein